MQHVYVQNSDLFFPLFDCVHVEAILTPLSEISDGSWHVRPGISIWCKARHEGMFLTTNSSIIVFTIVKYEQEIGCHILFQ